MSKSLSVYFETTQASTSLATPRDAWPKSLKSLAKALTVGHKPLPRKHGTTIGSPSRGQVAPPASENLFNLRQIPPYPDPPTKQTRAMRVRFRLHARSAGRHSDTDEKHEARKGVKDPVHNVLQFALASRWPLNKRVDNERKQHKVNPRKAQEPGLVESTHGTSIAYTHGCNVLWKVENLVLIVPQRRAHPGTSSRLSNTTSFAISMIWVAIADPHTSRNTT